MVLIFYGCLLSWFYSTCMHMMHIFKHACNFCYIHNVKLLFFLQEACGKLEPCYLSVIWSTVASQLYEPMTCSYNNRKPYYLFLSSIHTSNWPRSQATHKFYAWRKVDFLHGCKIKSESGLGTRLTSNHITPLRHTDMNLLIWLLECSS